MNKYALIGGLCLALVGGTALAEPSSRLAWTPETLAKVKNGSGVNGQKVAETCTACHGTDTQPATESTPILHGQVAAYIYKQLIDYKAGARINSAMSGIAAGLSEQEMADVAAWYSEQEIPAANQPEGTTALGEQLVKNGDGKRILPPCQACHEPNGKGQKIDVPALAGQNAEYTEGVLYAYKEGHRKNDLYGRMRSISQQLSDEEIKQLARYYSGMGR